ncbi:MAG: hypothetical protein WCD81_04530 [Candidatus Bathyarchaeia archaeon]
MSLRKTMRPVTLKRVVEVCSLASENEAIDIVVVSQRLGVSHSRAEEIVLEVEEMRLLTNLGDKCIANRETSEFLRHFENERWERIHEHFLEKYRFYRDFIHILAGHIDDEKGLSLEEIKEESTSRQLSLNQTAVEVLSDWCDRLGVIQRHLYTRRIYTVRKDIEPKIFKIALCKCYRELSTCHGRKGVFVEIPTMREDTCENLKIPRKTFDERLRLLFLENIGRIELSGAPIITLAKKSPFTEKKMMSDSKAAILSPKYEVKREREGLAVGQKTYYYLAIHESI